MTIRFNSENVDDIHRSLSRVYSDCDESFASLKYLISQISEDPAMLLFPETYAALESLQNAGSRLFPLKDRLYELCNVLAPVSGNFISCEKQIEEKIRQINSQLSVISACTEAIVKKDFSGIALHSSSETSNDVLSKLLTEDVCSYGIENLAPVNLVFKEKYGEAGEKK